MNMDFYFFGVLNNMAGKLSLIDTLMVLTAKYLPLVFGAILLLTWFSGKTKQENEDNRRAVVYAVVSAVLALGINQLIGFLYFRPRPFAEHAVKLLLPPSPDPSFPSDHAAGGFSLATSVFFKNKPIGATMLALAGLLAVSRVYVGMHYPLDVIGGACIGMVASYLVNRCKNWLEPFVKLAFVIWRKLVNLKSYLNLSERRAY